MRPNIPHKTWDHLVYEKTSLSSFNDSAILLTVLRITPGDVLSITSVNSEHPPATVDSLHSKTYYYNFPNLSSIQYVFYVLVY